MSYEEDNKTKPGQQKPGTSGYGTNTKDKGSTQGQGKYDKGQTPSNKGAPYKDTYKDK